MGWWGTDIMGGDTPLDIKGDIDRIMFTDDMLKEHNASYGDEMPLHVYHDSLKQYIVNWKEHFLPIVAQYGSDDYIVYQVLGWLCIENAVTIPEDLKAEVLKACDTDEEALGWKKVEERAANIAAFKEAVKNGNGKDLVMTRLFWGARLKSTEDILAAIEESRRSK